MIKLEFMKQLKNGSQNVGVKASDIDFDVLFALTQRKTSLKGCHHANHVMLLHASELFLRRNPIGGVSDRLRSIGAAQGQFCVVEKASEIA